MDMGFSREACLRALSHTNSLEAATDHLLTHPEPSPTDTVQPDAPQPDAPQPDGAAAAAGTSDASAPPLAADVVPPVAPAAAALDMDTGDEEQMMRAIAISLGQSYAAMTGQPLVEAPPVSVFTPITLHSV